MDIVLSEEFGSQYFAAVENGKEIGEANFRMDGSGKHMSITHVGVDPAYRGQGKAKELVFGVADYARKNGIKITPLCSYARSVFDRYQEDLADVRD